MSNLLRMLNFLVWSDVIQKLSPGVQIAMSSPSTPELYREYYRRFLDENQHISLYSPRSKNHVPDLLETFLPSYRHKKKNHPICPLSIRKLRSLYRRSAILSSPKFFDPRFPLMLKEPSLQQKFSHRISDRQKTEGKKGTENAKIKPEPSLASLTSDSPCSNKVEDSASPSPTMTSTSSDSIAFPIPRLTDYISSTEACSYLGASRYTCCSGYCSDPSCIAASTISSNLAILPTPSLRVHPYATTTHTGYPGASGYYSSPSQSTASNMVPFFYSEPIPRSSQIYYVPNVMPVTATGYSQSSTSLYSCYPRK